MIGLFDWFSMLYLIGLNRLKSNLDKCHAFVITMKHLNTKIDNYNLDKSVREKLLGVNRCS